MKTYTLTCNCGKTLTVCGKDIDEILAEIEKSQWLDHPRPDLDECPECADEAVIEYED